MSKIIANTTLKKLLPIYNQNITQKKLKKKNNSQNKYFNNANKAFIFK